jgi:hypothetical protein
MLNNLTDTYSSSDSVYDEATTSLVVLPGVGDKDRHLRILIEELLYATVVYTFASVSGTGLLSIIFGRVIVACFLWLRVVCIGVGGLAGRWRGIVGVVESCICQAMIRQPKTVNPYED